MGLHPSAGLAPAALGAQGRIGAGVGDSRQVTVRRRTGDMGAEQEGLIDG